MKAEEATKGKAIDVTIGEQVMTSTDPTFKPLAFEDSLQEAKEQTAKERTTRIMRRRELPVRLLQNRRIPKIPRILRILPQGPVGLFSHGTIS